MLLVIDQACTTIFDLHASWWYIQEDVGRVSTFHCGGILNLLLVHYWAIPILARSAILKSISKTSIIMDHGPISCTNFHLTLSGVYPSRNDSTCPSLSISALINKSSSLDRSAEECFRTSCAVFRKSMYFLFSRDLSRSWLALVMKKSLYALRLVGFFSGFIFVAAGFLSSRLERSCRILTWLS
jgi:hypothetical protein